MSSFLDGPLFNIMGSSTYYVISQGGWGFQMITVDYGGSFLDGPLFNIMGSSTYYVISQGGWVSQMMTVDYAGSTFSFYTLE